MGEQEGMRKEHRLRERKRQTETWGAKEHDSGIEYYRRRVFWQTHIPWLMAMRQKTIDEGKEKQFQELDEAAELEDAEMKAKKKKPFRDQSDPVFSPEVMNKKKQALHRRKEQQRRHNREKWGFGNVKASGLRWVRKSTAQQAVDGAATGAVKVAGN